MSTSGLADPMRPPPPPPPSEYVDPAWAPPVDVRRRPRWVPYVIVMVVAALVAAGFFVADRVGAQTFASNAQEFVPDDGAVQYSVRKVGKEDTPFVTESARFTGPEELTAVDFTFGTALLRALDNDLNKVTGVPFWRTTTTQIGIPESTQQVVRVYRVGGPVELLGESGPGTAHVYSPALVELPADVSPGQSWVSSGSAGAVLDYRSEFRAEAADRGCLRVSGLIIYTAKNGRSSRTETVNRGWCPREGVREDQVGSAARQAEPPVQTTGEPVVWRDPARWKNQRFTTVSIDQNFGQGMMTGAPSGVPPVVTASGLVVRANSSSDLIAFTPKTPAEWTSLWRMRPGGTVVSLTAFGDVVVATTSGRRVVGYSASGVRLWQHDLDEVAFRGPARIDDTRIALADSGGTVRVLDLASGAQRWQRNLRAEVKVAPVADPRAVVVADGGGDLTAFSPDDGTELWSKELEVTGATIVGDTVVTYSAATLTALSITDAKTRWLEPLTGTVDALVAFDGRVVLATQISTTVRGEGGAVQATFDPYVLLTVTSGHLVGWGSERAQVIDRSLRVVTAMDTPDRGLATGGNWPVADRFGVTLYGADWSFQTWSDQP